MYVGMGRCKSWTLDYGLDRGLDRGLDHGLDGGLDFGPKLIMWMAHQDFVGRKNSSNTVELVRLNKLYS